MIHTANQLTGFYMIATLALNGLKKDLISRSVLFDISVIRDLSLF